MSVQLKIKVAGVLTPKHHLDLTSDLSLHYRERQQGRPCAPGLRCAASGHSFQVPQGRRSQLYQVRSSIVAWTCAFQCSDALLAVRADPIPLGRHVRDGRYTLAVVKELSAGYLTAPPSLANKDVAKSFVVVSTRMWSSIYTQDKQLRSFFRMIRPTGYWPGPTVTGLSP